MTPGANPIRGIERHHLFPSGLLPDDRASPRSTCHSDREYGFIDRPDDAVTRTRPQAAYWPEMAQRLDPERLRQQQHWHALPVGVSSMNADGGTLLIGVHDAGHVLGPGGRVPDTGQANRDGYELSSLS